MKLNSKGRKIINKNMKYDIKKTIKKFVIISVEVIIAGVIALETQRPELLALVPILEAIRNIAKHKFGLKV